MTCVDCDKFLPIGSKYKWVRVIDINDPYFGTGDPKKYKLRYCCECKPPVCCKCNNPFFEAEFNDDDTYTCIECYEEDGGVMCVCVVCDRTFGENCDNYEMRSDKIICGWHIFNERWNGSKSSE